METSPLVDSTAAAVGALGATLALYPLDVAKTRIQTEQHSPAQPRGTLATCAAIAREGGVRELLVGVGPKAVSTVLSSFVFYYVFESLKRLYARTGLAPGTISSLALGSLAGAINACATLPADTVTTRLQAGGRAELEGCASACSHIYAESGIAGCAPRRARGPRDVERRRAARRPERDARPRSRAPRHLAGRFWRGLSASLMLVANPAINVTVFDALRARLLVALAAAERAVDGDAPPQTLSGAQAFLLGCLAKAVATLLTYPLIRVKVLQQAAKARELKRQQSAPTLQAPPPRAPDGRGGALGESGGALALLRELWRREGARGLYVGFSAQLFTTVLKAGLLLAGKERALALTLRLLSSRRRLRTRPH
jgi:aspartate-semialdehyde dehydrogenase/adenine nucleotide transporter 17